MKSHHIYEEYAKTDKEQASARYYAYSPKDMKIFPLCLFVRMFVKEDKQQEQEGIIQDSFYYFVDKGDAVVQWIVLISIFSRPLFLVAPLTPGEFEQLLDLYGLVSLAERRRKHQLCLMYRLKIHRHDF